MSTENRSSKEELAEILSNAHAIYCAAGVGMPCDCQVPDAIAELLRRAEPPPSRIGPTEPDDTMVICPVCTSQFRAIPLDVQRVRDELLAALRNALPVLEFELETRGSNDLLYEIPACPVLDAARAAIARVESRSDE